jgi:predicted phosphate transport protein (TIGR00153 family)
LEQEDKRLNLLPKDEKFFEYFHQQSEILCQAGHLLLSGLEGGYEGMCHVAKRMEALERSGDEVMHQLFDRLRQTFITPFDPEDIQSLATALDNVLDTMEDATFRIVAYRIDPIPPAAVELGGMISSSCRALDSALRALQAKKPVMEACIEVNRLEEDADAVERTMLAKLFSSDIDAITLIKLKELYELLESATDRCEDVADVIQNISVKNL